MDAADLVRLTNRGMIVFDLALGTGALAAPEDWWATGCAAVARRRR